MDGINFDMTNRNIRNAIAIGKLYGIKWTRMAQLGDMSPRPQTGRKNIYFVTSDDALKVANYYNMHSEDKQYSVVLVTYDTLKNMTKACEDKKVKKENPLTYDKIVNFRIYGSASEYFRTMGINPAIDVVSDDIVM